MALAMGAFLSAGCAAKTPKVAALPPAPAPQTDPPALIFPQTVLELPDPQPVPPEAIVKRDVASQPAVAETPPAHTPPRHPSAIAKREPEPAADPSPEPVKPSARTPLIPVDPNLPNSDMIQKRIDALKATEPKLSSKPGRDAEMTRSRIQYFIDQAAKALARKDLRQATALVSRAEVLAEDLLGAR
jgi:hypothetical protein